MKKCFAWYAHFNMASSSVTVAGAVVFEAAWHGIVDVDAILHCSIPTFFPRQSCCFACSLPFLEWLAPTVLFRFCSFAFFGCCVLYIICTLWSLCFTELFLLPFSSSHHFFFAVLLVLLLFLAMHNLVIDIGQGLVYLVLDMYPTCLTLFPLFCSLIVLVQLIKILTDLLVTFTPLS